MSSVVSRRVPRTKRGQPFSLDTTSRIYNKLARCVSRVGAAPSQYPYNISISHSNKFVWYRVAKTGTRSFLSLLEKQGVVLDAEHPMQTHYQSASFQDYFKFSIVRNPWDRLVSTWNNKVVDQNWWNFPADEYQRLRSFPQFVQFVLQMDPNSCDVHLRSQCSVVDLNNVDYVGRFEHLSSEIQTIGSKLNLGLVAMPHKNQSKERQHYSEYYDKKLYESVRSFYIKDVQVFGYN